MGIIYIAINKINGKSYVGKTEKTLKQRISAHCCRVRFGSKYAFHNAIRKYGIESFEWKILLSNISSENIDTFEIEEIKKHNCIIPNGYNISNGGGGGDTISNHPRKEEILGKMRIANLGKKLSTETKERMSVSRLGNQNKKGYKETEETRRKKSQATKGRVSPLIGTHIDEKTKMKISNAMSGKRKSETHKANIGLAHKGKVLSIETRKKISDSRKGIVSTSKLTLDMVIDIKDKLRNKPRDLHWDLLYKNLAEKYNVSPRAISKIKFGNTWKNCKG